MTRCLATAHCAPLLTVPAAVAFCVLMTPRPMRALRRRLLLLAER